MTTVHDLSVHDTKISTLKQYANNPRKGDVAAIAESLSKVGQYKPVIVNKGSLTGKVNEVLAGNHTVQAAKSLKWSTIKTVFVDVDAEVAARIVLADNKTADLGGYDNDLLAGLLVDLPDLEGTGYTPAELDDMLADIQEATNEAVNSVGGGAQSGPPPSAPSGAPSAGAGGEFSQSGGESGGTDPYSEWEGMPHYENEKKQDRQLVVHFLTDEAVEEFARLMEQPITERTKYIYYPYKPKESTIDIRYTSATDDEADTVADAA